MSIIKSENFCVSCKGIKENASIDVYAISRALVRRAELAKKQNNKVWKDGIETLNNSYPESDYIDLEKEKVNLALAEDAPKWLELRDDILSIKKDLETLPDEDVYTSLCETDKAHVIIQAHSVSSLVNFPRSYFLPDENEEKTVDLEKALAIYFNNGKLADMKSVLRPIFKKLFSTESENFWAIDVKKSNFSEPDLRKFASVFVNTDGRRAMVSEKGADGKNNKKPVGQYNWVTRFNDVDLQARAFTTLCAVVLDDVKKIQILKPENQPEEK
jgi:hypothetical protein